MQDDEKLRLSGQEDYGVQERRARRRLLPLTEFPFPGADFDFPLTIFHHRARKIARHCLQDLHNQLTGAQTAQRATVKHAHRADNVLRRVILCDAAGAATPPAGCRRGARLCGEAGKGGAQCCSGYRESMPARSSIGLA